MGVSIDSLLELFPTAKIVFMTSPRCPRGTTVAYLTWSAAIGLEAHRGLIRHITQERLPWWLKHSWSKSPNTLQLRSYFKWKVSCIFGFRLVCSCHCLGHGPPSFVHSIHLTSFHSLFVSSFFCRECTVSQCTVSQCTVSQWQYTVALPIFRESQLRLKTLASSWVSLFSLVSVSSHSAMSIQKILPYLAHSAALSSHCWALSIFYISFSIVAFLSHLWL